MNNSLQNFNYQSLAVNDITMKFMEDKDSGLSVKKNDENSLKLNLPKMSEDNKDSIINRKDFASSDLELTDKIKI